MGGTEEIATEVLEVIESDGPQLAICLVSGGMDSCVTAAIAERENDELAFLHVSYGQRTEQRERQAFEALADFFRVKARLAISLEQLARIVDGLSVPVLCYGLRTDFRGELFPGSARLLALADELTELKTICHCGRKATMVVRVGADGVVEHDGEQVEIGGNERYVSLCRRHYFEASGRRPPG